uniref:Uncharacterized protein n=1 Tax=Hyaloperonospora arabidopsidis (strain Emoy2) TaxID=559515 RepID=M4BL80_HYAAE
MNIPVLPPAKPVLEDDFRENYMEEIMEEVKRSEQMRSEEGARNMSLLPTIRDGSTAAVKAFSTYIPGSSMLTHLMDGSRIPVAFGRSDASGLFSAFPEFDNDELTIDPDPRLLQPSYTHGYKLAVDANECSVLRIAMSTIGEADESNVDTEVLLEAISMDIWDSDLKYTSNLPISEQLNLPENTVDGKHMNGRMLVGQDVQENRQTDDAKRGRDVSPRAEGSDLPENLHVEMPILAASSKNDCTPIDKSNQLLVHRALASTDEVRAAQRAIQKYFGAAPSCEVKIRCIVGGRMAISSELELTVRRDISELTSELHAASATAEKTKHLTRRLWPASGITRVCACLTSVYLLQGDMAHVQTTIKAWLNCFDPTAQHAEADDCMEDKNMHPNKTAMAYRLREEIGT